MTATLDVIDSYLALNSTQYAQAPIGATRVATNGNGSSLYGTIPTWSATNWEVEFDIVFPTAYSGSLQTVIDSITSSNRANFNINATTGYLAFGSTVTATLDGVSVIAGTTAHPLDGAVHHLKYTGNTVREFATLLRSYSLSNTSNCTIFNLRLTDLDTPANSRFYPMDEDSSSAVITDTSSNAQHGTWYNRASGDIVTVYPDAIKPAETFFMAARLRVTSLGSETYPMAFSVGGALGSTIVKVQLPLSGTLYVEVWNISSTGVKTNIGGTTLSNVASGGDWAALGEITVVFKKNGTTGQSECWVSYGNQNRYVSISKQINGYAIQGKINLNGEIDTSENIIRKLSGINFHYVYLYSALSAGDITALMQGANPESVGTIRQGYNLNGNGSEVNGGNALTLYNAPSFVRPAYIQSLVNKMIGYTLTRSLIGSIVTTG